MNEKFVKPDDETSKWFSSKTFILSLFFIFGIVVLILLYVNFKFTYQFSGINQQIAELDSNQSELKYVSQQLLSSKNQLPKLNNASIARVALENTQQELNCKALLHFVQDYYQMRLQAEYGENFSSKLLGLNQYEINVIEINKNINALANLAANNVEDSYLINEFNNLIKEIYSNEYSNSLWRNYFKKIIFIKPIGKRALEKGGLDKEIILTEDALSQNNLLDANIHLENLSKYLEEENLRKLQELQLALQNKLSIREIFVNLDQLMAKQYNCSIVVNK